MEELLGSNSNFFGVKDAPPSAATLFIRKDKEEIKAWLEKIKAMKNGTWVEPKVPVAETKQSNRPVSLDEIKGQDDAIRLLKIAILSAKKRGKVLAHTLLTGPSGCGKTTIANVIASEIGASRCIEMIGSSLSSDSALKAVVEKVCENGEVGNVLYIDEVHTLSTEMQVSLLRLMEDFVLSVKNPGEAMPKLYKTPPFVVVAATTNPGELSKPLYDRFVHKPVLTQYSVSDMQGIVRFNVAKLDYLNTIDDEACYAISAAARGVARIAVSCVKTAQDVAVALDMDTISIEAVFETFKVLGMNQDGLYEKTEIKLLKHLYSIYPQAIGLSSMAQILEEDEKQVVKIYEPTLISMGLIERVKTGRKLTEYGTKYMESNGYCGHSSKSGLIQI
jgi:Holliday junction DNA helicase RuvB